MERPRPALARFALALLLAVGCAGARPVPRDTGQLVYWEVESATNPGARAFLLGSIHVASPDLVLDPRIRDGFEASDALVIEVDLEAADGAATQQWLTERAVLPEGQTLASVLSHRTWRRLERFLRAHQMPPELFQWYEPWFLVSVVPTVLLAERGAEPGAGIDQRFLDLAGGRMEIVALETVEFQLDLLADVPRPLAIRMLEEMLEDVGATRDVTQGIYDAWSLGDLDYLEALTLGETDDPELAEFQERTFFARNRTMAERIDALLGEPRTWFVVVGAAHMAGDEGIPELLEGRGHRVTRIERSP